MHKVFVTGINTEVGKTVASAVMVEALQADYWKPVQCGELENTDSQKIQNLISNSTTKIFPERYKLKAAESPHYAASLENVQIELSDFQLPTTSNYLIIEGAGGICVPLNQHDFFIDLLPKSTPIILVSKNELGSINATLLSLYYLKKEGFQKIGIVFNGAEKPSTENIIIEKYPIFNIGRLTTATELNPEFIQEQAQRLQSSIQEFLKL